MPITFFIPPGELHLLLGCFNTIFKKLLEIFPGASKWSEDMGWFRQQYHGGEFVGNDCRKLISVESTSKLEELGVRHSNFDIPPFVKAFRALNEVKNSCFGNKLQPDFQEKLAKFKENVLDLKRFGVNVATKFHILFFHTHTWCEKENIGLGIVSEQASESLHSKFQKTIQHFRVNPNRSNFEEQLLRATVYFNSGNL